MVCKSTEAHKLDSSSAPFRASEIQLTYTALGVSTTYPSQKELKQGRGQGVQGGGGGFSGSLKVRAEFLVGVKN